MTHNLMLRAQKSEVRDYFENINHKDYLEKHNREFYRVIYSELLESRNIHNKLGKREQVILDLGAGSCEFVFLLLDKYPEENHKIIAIDFSENMLRKASPELHCNYSNHDSLVADMVRCPLKEECSDIIFCINSIPYIADLDSMLKEINRLARPKGYLAVVFPNNRRIWTRKFENIRVFDNRDLHGAAFRNNFNALEERVITFNLNESVKSMVIPIAKFMLFQVEK